jgi:hypothetical protein
MLDGIAGLTRGEILPPIATPIRCTRRSIEPGREAGR